MMNRIKGILYDIVLMAASMGMRKAKNKKLLIIRTDEIGDYILWRKFIPEIIYAERFKEYEIHFCGNISWKVLFEIEYSSSFSKIHWLHKTNFKKNLSYRFSFLKKIYSEKYTTVINPVYSRAKRIEDSIAKAAKPNYSIAMKRNNENYATYEQGFDNNLYNELMPELTKPIFEFNRNKKFTEFIIKSPSKITNTVFNISSIRSSITDNLPEKYFVVFPGSRSSSRIWPAQNFAAVSNYLFEKYKWTVIICGSASDEAYASNFKNNYSNPYVDLIGKTGLSEMLLVLQKAQCLLSVDTGSVHLAASVGCTVFGIYNGSQYGRFAPYSKDVSENVFAIYPDEVEKDIQENNLASYEFIVNIPYSKVSAKKTIEVVKHHFNLQHEI